MKTNITGHLDISYDIVLKNFKNINFYSLKSLDESIDKLCELLGDELMDDALKEDHCPYFGVPWEAGLGLTQYLSNLLPKIDIKNSRFIEIGCGLALPSFYISTQGGNVLATDYHPDVEIFLRENQKLNALQFDFFKMNWRNEYHELGLFDYVIGSDVLYESNHPEAVAKALIRFLKPNGKIILSDPGRAYVQSFVKAMNGLGFKEKMTIESIETSWTKKDIFIFEF
jgi:predicted nicotinamide N-methyase